VEQNDYAKWSRAVLLNRAVGRLSLRSVSVDDPPASDKLLR
jgi:hypothetical protein